MNNSIFITGGKNWMEHTGMVELKGLANLKGVLQMAIIFYLTEKTGSALVLSIASLAGFLPYALLGPAIGVLVDRYDRKLVMMGADIIIALAGALLTVIALFMELPIWVIMVVLCIRSIGSAFHTPALSAVTPQRTADEMRRLQPVLAVRQLYS